MERLGVLHSCGQGKDRAGGKPVGMVVIFTLDGVLV